MGIITSYFDFQTPLDLRALLTMRPERLQALDVMFDFPEPLQFLSNTYQFRSMFIRREKGMNFTLPHPLHVRLFDDAQTYSVAGMTLFEPETKLQTYYFKDANDKLLFSVDIKDILIDIDPEPYLDVPARQAVSRRGESLSYNFTSPIPVLTGTYHKETEIDTVYEIIGIRTSDQPKKYVKEDGYRNEITLDDKKWQVSRIRLFTSVAVKVHTTIAQRDRDRLAQALSEHWNTAVEGIPRTVASYVARTRGRAKRGKRKRRNVGRR